ncbi:hypothetical protein BDV11DRAFT_28011 [Aspergillus similis]
MEIPPIRIQDSGFRTQDPGPRTQDPASSIQRLATSPPSRRPSSPVGHDRVPGSGSNLLCIKILVRLCGGAKPKQGGSPVHIAIVPADGLNPSLSPEELPSPYLHPARRLSVALSLPLFVCPGRPERTGWPPGKNRRLSSRKHFPRWFLCERPPTYIP